MTTDVLSRLIFLLGIVAVFLGGWSNGAGHYGPGLVSLCLGLLCVLLTVWPNPPGDSPTGLH